MRVVKPVGIEHFFVIGGERAKGGHVGCWEGCDWSRKGMTSLFPIRVMSPVKSKIGGGVSDVECHGGRPILS